MVQFQLPPETETYLREEAGDLDAIARDALLADAYKRRFISIGKLGELLGIGVIAAHEWLAQRDIPLNYSIEDLEADFRAAQNFRKEIDK